MQHNNWAKDRDLLAEAYGGAIEGRESADEDIPPQYQDENRGIGEEEPQAEDGETVGDFDQFIEKAERFVDAIGDSELEFLMNLGKHQFEILMQVVKDEHGYRSAPRD